MEEEDEEPIIDLSEKQNTLRSTILEDPIEAWRLLQEDPAMILALTKVKREWEEDKRPNITEFFEEYDAHVRTIFGKEHPIERYGIALATEFLIEYWRRSVNSTDLNSINEAILKKMAIMIEATDQLPESDKKKITSKIVQFSTQRILDYADYDRLKAHEHVSVLESELHEFIEMILKQKDINKTLSLSYFASASTEAIEILRNKIAAILLDKLKPRFENYTEEDKFKIAPYLGVFQQIIDQDDKESDDNQSLKFEDDTE